MGEQRLNPAQAPDAPAEMLLKGYPQEQLRHRQALTLAGSRAPSRSAHAASIQLAHPSRQQHGRHDRSRTPGREPAALVQAQRTVKPRGRRKRGKRADEGTGQARGRRRMPKGHDPNQRAKHRVDGGQSPLRRSDQRRPDERLLASGSDVAERPKAVLRRGDLDALKMLCRTARDCTLSYNQISTSLFLKEYGKGQVPNSPTAQGYDLQQRPVHQLRPGRQELAAQPWR